MAVSDSSGSAQRGIPGDPLLGQLVNDRFRILSVIARGGMGQVYRAEQVPLGRPVAIKTLDPRESGAEADPQFQQRFFLEASIASKLQHPNTVTVFDYGRTASGQYFMAMELVDGEPLNQVLRREKRLPAERVVHIALQIARSLREAHRLDVIHRDLKPANVILTRHGDEDDFVKVLDFGLVKQVRAEPQEQLTRAGLFMGSPKYMAPEQIRGERIDARCDVYALGVCMYEMLTGRVPFESDNAVSVLMAHIHEEVTPIADASVSPAVTNLVMRCLAKVPDARPASMDELVMALKQASGAPANPSGAFPMSGELLIPATSGLLRIQPASDAPEELVAAPQSSLPPLPPLLLSKRHPSAAQRDDRGSTPGQRAMLTTGPMVVVTSRTSYERWLPKLAVLAAFLFLAAAIALRLRGSRAHTLPVAIPVAATAPSAPVAPAPHVTNMPEPAPALARFTVHLTSSPPGARVRMGERSFGKTPLTIELEGAEAIQGREIGFQFEREGYAPATAYRIVRGDELTIEADLPRASPGAVRP